MQKKINKKMANHIQQTISDYKEYRNIPLTEPLDSDEVEKLIYIIEIEIEHNEGNISEQEYELLTNITCKYWRKIRKHA